MNILRRIQHVAITILLIYASLVFTSLMYGIITTGTIDPEGFAFVVGLDGPIDTVTIIIIVYLLSVVGKFILKPLVLVPIVVISQALLLALAHHFTGAINLFNFWLVYLVLISAGFAVVKIYLKFQEGRGAFV